MEHIIENSNYQKFKETTDDYITNNLNEETIITIMCKKLKDNTISYTIGCGSIKETIEELELTLKQLKNMII